VGLGNPGTRYARTRHNLGFRVVEVVAARHEATRWKSKFSGKLAEAVSAGVVFLLPQTYMNDSGESVAPCAAFFRISPPRILVVCDDLNLPFGRLRMRRNGSDGGHNGLKSIIAALASQDFPRLRMGIGRASGDPIDHVIGVFDKLEEAELPEIVQRAASGVERFLCDGADAAIATVNAFGGGLLDLDESFENEPDSKKP
jgi:peptidyl-tRNA hydrolase, PTH1 family